ncbi:SDR family NAD(P)-dependent oxidoreductase [Furfurilactobacillus siliginis]|uniref:Short chain dehydrogenase n=1 Tax=Furfurilactobacillus siliginis TaxID=348151 RepID=A0A0R2LCE7_9LACO|nr:SDR family NAD(P)-dependent oxidoreductase [Furfurilactobacillus siliginis]KRN96343.1 short chain dehydrogenase [Furfurilactobacillus siliginis]GEK29348.1 short-chain dehydrogenase/reductase [Furfurilactobacillus siliginis]
MTKVAVVTGASSGIGRQTALALKADGYQVIGGSRHISEDVGLKAAGIDAHNLDVTDHSSVTAFVAYVIDTYQHIDILVNSAGYGLFGALAEVSLTEARMQLEVNVFGIMDLIQGFLPTMMADKRGRIINISSLAGQSYFAMAGWYHVSKHALETMTDVLRLELADFDIDVVIVEPGITKTNWANVTNTELLANTPQTSPYRKLAEKQAATITQATQTVHDVAAVIMKAVHASKPKIRYQVRFRERLMMNLTRLTGFRLQDRVARHMMK